MSDYKNEILAEADKIIHGERNEQYGEPEDAFRNIAQLWNVYVNHCIAKVFDDVRDVRTDLNMRDDWCDDYTVIDKHDVAMMMILLKVARTNGTKKKDNYVDIAGYAALAAKL